MSTPRILIVEDEKPQRDNLRARAERAGFKSIFACGREEEALQLWREKGGFTALLLDLRLRETEEEGYVLLRFLREQPRSPERVFVRSAYLKGLKTILQAVAVDRFSFYMKDQADDESQLDADLRAFVSSIEMDGREPVS